ncbi:MAG TPA: YpdA family putative bacillithiol disulfide reductase [Thermoanaerobaculia bacterium]|nr:YpdA family putative bacillithiol disulfide reductase [Thermoanaerobaculia bacterium]
MAPSESPVAIVGAGPTGIACAIELSQRGVAAVCYDKGFLLDTIYHFPEEMRWFSTRDLLDIAGVPFSTPDAHPTRLESLAYYRGVAEKFRVRVLPHTRVHEIRSHPPRGLLLSIEDRTGRREITAPAAIFATGFFGNPRRLDVPGEDRPHVHRRFVSAYPFHDRDVVVIGSKNSAAEAALDLYRHGARVTLLARNEAISDRVKYWIKPDLENRIRAGAIRAVFRARILEITSDAVLVDGPQGRLAIGADAVFPLIGYQPDFTLFEASGIRLEGPNRVPAYDPETLETNVPNLYLAGAILGGTEIGRIFIENSRHHAGLIASAIARRLSAVTTRSDAPTAS